MYGAQTAIHKLDVIRTRELRCTQFRLYIADGG